MAKVKAVPEGFRTVTPHLVIDGASDAMEFYKRAFGAKENARMTAPDGKKLWHAEMTIGDSRIMLADSFPEMGGGPSPKAAGGSTVVVHLYVPNCDAVFQQAVGEGAKALMPPTDMFWGDRYGQIEDPFGHRWSIATHTEDLTPDQMKQRAAAFEQKGNS